MPRCPYCGYEGGFKLIKIWKFVFYGVMMLQHLKCGGIFNHYYGVNSRTVRVAEFVVRIRPRVRK